MFEKSSRSDNRRDVPFPGSIKGVQLSDSDVDRFWRKVQKEDGCWRWLSSLNPRNGYGQFTIGPRRCRKLVTAHRLAWVLSHGSIPDGLCVLHHCDMPACVNPDHLFLGTQDDNMADAAAKGRLRVPRRRNRHVKPELITRYLAGDGTQAELATEYGVAPLTAHRWLRGYHPPHSRPAHRRKPARAA